jgi:hypothetical protein
MLDRHYDEIPSRLPCREAPRPSKVRRTVVRAPIHAMVSRSSVGAWGTPDHLTSQKRVVERRRRVPSGR